MRNEFIADVHDTLCGFRHYSSGVEGVQNLFAPGEPCEILYSRAQRAYDRLRERLGVEDEDPDIECIFDSLMQIEYEVSRKMYEYGAAFGNK